MVFGLSKVIIICVVGKSQVNALTTGLLADASPTAIPVVLRANRMYVSVSPVDHCMLPVAITRILLLVELGVIVADMPVTFV